ncbi:DUF4160 domain-containing protein [Rhodococcus hoagii]|nr:DUF4160 domain-containing protein [Prescottella equi]
MRKHPDNPLWDHERDLPIMIYTRLEWEEAAESGHLTAEHVLQRLKNIADHVFENEGAAAFNEDGFVAALIAEGLSLPNGVKLHVYPKDHPPPHVHVEVRAQPGAKIRVSLVTGEYLDEIPAGIKSKQLKNFQAEIVKHYDLLESWWEKNHGPVTLG